MPNQEKYIVALNFRSFWTVGTGREAGGYTDSVTLKDADNLPYVPGSSLKGMFRQAALEAKDSGWFDEFAVNNDGKQLFKRLFGQEGVKPTDEIKRTIFSVGPNADVAADVAADSAADVAADSAADSDVSADTDIAGNENSSSSVNSSANPCSSELYAQGILYFGNAELAQEDRDYIIQKNAQELLYQNIHSIKIDSKTGVTTDGSLRSTEYSVPLELYAEVSFDPCCLEGVVTKDNLKEVLKTCCRLVTAIGGHRRRGAGSCVCELIEVNK